MRKEVIKTANYTTTVVDEGHGYKSIFIHVRAKGLDDALFHELENITDVAILHLAIWI